MVAGLTAPDVENRLALGLRLRDAGLRVLAYYLADMADRRLHQELGFRTTAQFAEARLGLTRRRTHELIGVAHALAVLPDVDRAMCARRITWSKAVMLSRVVSPVHETQWLERAVELSQRELAREIQRAKPGGPPLPKGVSDPWGLPKVRFRVSVDVNAVVHSKWELAKQKLGAERGAPVGDADCIDILADLLLSTDEDGTVPGRTRVSGSLFKVVVHQTFDDDKSSDANRRSDEDGTADTGMFEIETELGPTPIDSECVACDAEHVVEDEHVFEEEHVVEDEEAATATATGQITTGQITTGGIKIDEPTSTRLRNKVIARDNHRCRSCGSRHRLMAHHIEFRQNGGPTIWSNLITLCAGCHALVHKGLLTIQGTDQRHVRFVDRKGRALHDPHEYATGMALQALMPPPAACGLSLSHEVRRAADATRKAGRRLYGEAIEPLPHTLFAGANAEDGTVLAQTMAERAGVRFAHANGRYLQDRESWDRLVFKRALNCVFFIADVELMAPEMMRVWEDHLERMGAPYAIVISTEHPERVPTFIQKYIQLRDEVVVPSCEY